MCFDAMKYLLLRWLVFMNYVSVTVICMIGLPADFSYMFSYLVGCLCVYFWHIFHPTCIFVVAPNCSTARVLSLQLSLKRTVLYSGQIQFSVLFFLLIFTKVRKWEINIGDVTYCYSEDDGALVMIIQQQKQPSLIPLIGVGYINQLRHNVP